MFDWVLNMPLNLKLRKNGKMRTQKEERLILLKILMTKICKFINLKDTVSKNTCFLSGTYHLCHSKFFKWTPMHAGCYSF